VDRVVEPVGDRSVETGEAAASDTWNTRVLNGTATNTMAAAKRLRRSP
jgi:hypothetical protein